MTKAQLIAFYAIDCETYPDAKLFTLRTEAARLGVAGVDDMKTSELLRRYENARA